MNESTNTGRSRGCSVSELVGAVLAIVAVNVLNAFARVNASIASSLLGLGDPATDQRRDQPV